MNGDQEMKFEMLNDITKIAAIKATSALSKILEFPIGVDIIPVEIKRLDELKTIMSANEKVVGLNVPILGPLPGVSLFIFSENAALSVCDVMFHRDDGTTNSFGEMEISALSEAANIVIGNFLTSFATPLQIESLIHKPADFNFEKFVNFINEVSQGLKRNAAGSIFVEISFNFQHIRIKGMAIFLFDEVKMLELIKKI